MKDGVQVPQARGDHPVIGSRASGIVVALVIAAAAGCAGGQDGDGQTSTNTPGQGWKSGDVELFAGDCYAVAQGSYQVVDCSSSHDGEVVAVTRKSCMDPEVLDEVAARFDLTAAELRSKLQEGSDVQLSMDWNQSEGSLCTLTAADGELDAPVADLWK